MKVGDKIRIQFYNHGEPSEQKDYTVEEYRHCLGVFLSGQDREMSKFTPLCEMYEPGPESERKYMPNCGDYWTNEVQGWMDI
jgi:hypothetical protein